MNFPVWIDLKGQDSVPDTVHHVVCRVNPVTMTMWKNLTNHWETDAVHCNDIMNSNQPSKGKVHRYVFVPTCYGVKPRKSRVFSQKFIGFGIKIFSFLWRFVIFTHVQNNKFLTFHQLQRKEFATCWVNRALLWLCRKNTTLDTRHTLCIKKRHGLNHLDQYIQNRTAILHILQ